MPKEMEAELAILYYLTRPDVPFQEARKFTNHEIEDQCRIWLIYHFNTSFSGGTLVRAKDRLLKANLLGDIIKTRVPKKRYYSYQHNLRYAQIKGLIYGWNTIKHLVSHETYAKEKP